MRWQPPQAPTVSRTQILPGDTLPQNCPQSPDSPIPAGYNFTGNEDCLFLSVYAPQNKTNMPVLVWIHGGGYGAGQGNEDMSPIINANNNNFIAVAIQYRVRDWNNGHEYVAGADEINSSVRLASYLRTR
jgi:carboxylesterase type B